MASEFARGVWTAEAVMFGTVALTWAYCSGKAWVLDRRGPVFRELSLAVLKPFRKVIALGNKAFMRLTKRGVSVNFSDVIRDCARSGEHERGQGNPVSGTHNVVPFRKAR